MSKTEKLKQAYEEMKQGKIIEFIPDPGKAKLKTGCRCWIAKSRQEGNRKKYIFWQYFGSSANRMSLSELRWIAKTIAECTTYNYKVVSSVY